MSRPSGPRSRRAQSSPPLILYCYLESAPLPTREGLGGTDAPQGAASGGKNGDDGRLRPEATCFPPVGGDRQIADCSAAISRHRNIKRTICVYLRDLRFFPLGGRPTFVSLCLRRARLCTSVFFSVSSVPLWFNPTISPGSRDADVIVRSRTRDGKNHRKRQRN